MEGARWLWYPAEERKGVLKYLARQIVLAKVCDSV